MLIQKKKLRTMKILGLNKGKKGKEENSVVTIYIDDVISMKLF